MNEQICICGFIGFFHKYVEMAAAALPRLVKQHHGQLRGAEIPSLQRGTPVISTQ